MSNDASQSPIDGFYVAYFTGATGSSFGMFVFRDGLVVGADAGGGRYDGTYAVTAEGKQIEAVIKFTLPVGNFSITGATAQTEPISVEVPLKLPAEFNRMDVHRIETPIGPINAKFDKVRGL